jgi:hypothetical protein
MFHLAGALFGCLASIDNTFRKIPQDFAATR